MQIMIKTFQLMLSSPDEYFDFNVIYQNIKEKIGKEITDGEVTGAIGTLQKMGLIKQVSESKKEFELTSQGRHSNPWILEQALNRIYRGWGEQHGGRKSS
ncbi:MAG: hypothetical protein EX285_01000 [Thaumarchaeota archaeon]|nr:hypothetical protein [Nitrososphaerota archaeon]